MKAQTVQVKFDAKTLVEMSGKIADEVSNKMYYELLLARYTSEIMRIQKGEIKALKGREAEKYLKQRISSVK